MGLGARPELLEPLLLTATGRPVPTYTLPVAVRLVCVVSKIGQPKLLLAVKMLLLTLIAFSAPNGFGVMLIVHFPPESQLPSMTTLFVVPWSWVIITAVLMPP